MTRPAHLNENACKRREASQPTKGSEAWTAQMGAINHPLTRMFTHGTLFLARTSGPIQLFGTAARHGAHVVAEPFQAAWSRANMMYTLSSAPILSKARIARITLIDK